MLCSSSYFRSQLLIFLPQFFPLLDVIEGQAGNTGNRSHHLQMVFVEFAEWVRAVQVDDSEHPLGDQQRDAKQRAHFQFRQSFDLTHGVASRHVTNHQADTIGQYALHYSAADANGMTRAAYPVPGGG